MSYQPFFPNRSVRPASRGFTIIEVIIVLALAALILLVVLLAVPALHRSSRNYDRRHLVDFTGAQLHQYEIDNGHLPATAAEGTSFIDNYLSGTSAAYTIQFRGIGGSHTYFPVLDTVAIQYGHWCNKYGDGDSPNDPIAGNDLNPHNFVVWTQIEPSTGTPQGTYCIDNHY